MPVTVSHNNTRPVSRYPQALVIDDNADMAEIIGAILKQQGYETEILTHTRNIREKLKNHKAELIFLDLCIPDTDGIEVIKILAELKSSASLVIMSGRSSDMLKCATTFAERHGVNIIDYLNKPFRVEEVFEILNRIRKAESISN